MRFALSGDGPTALAVARAVCLDRAHEIVAVVGPRHSGPAYPPLNAGIRSCRGWEELLVDCPVDAVILSK